MGITKTLFTRMQMTMEREIVICIGTCFCCNKSFMFHPQKVPSYKNVEPICEDCVREANSVRKQKGMTTWPILPGAYEAGILTKKFKSKNDENPV